MNLYHLRYFVTLAQYEHYTRAAQELMITQPSLSHAIAAMEEELKVKLFEKEGRNIVLTRFGQCRPGAHDYPAQLKPCHCGHGGGA